MNKIIKIRFGHFLVFLCLQSVAGILFASDRSANTVILDKQGVENLGIEVVEVERRDFEETLFALGRVEAIASNRGIVSSRIAGRIVELSTHEGDFVKKGQIVVKVESRRPGNPPPVIELEAPLDGLVMRGHPSIGEPVEPDEHIFEIIDLTEVYVIAEVPEDQVARLGIGTEARITIPALGDKEFVGPLHRFGTMVHRESGTFDAVFRIKTMKSELRPDMRAEFSIIVEKRKNVMSVPVAALQGDSVNRYVFVKDFDLQNAFVKAPVRVGAQNGRFVEIFGGLFPGDEVVTRGSYALSFAGGGGISLKEALDAAHGHEHNEDGSEMTAAQKAAQAREKALARGESGNAGPLNQFFVLLSGVLFFLLVMSLFLRRAKPEKSEETVDA